MLVRVRVRVQLKLWYFIRELEIYNALRPPLSFLLTTARNLRQIGNLRAIVVRKGNDGSRAYLAPLLGEPEDYFNSQFLSPA